VRSCWCGLWAKVHKIYKEEVLLFGMTSLLSNEKYVRQLYDLMYCGITKDKVRKSECDDSSKIYRRMVLDPVTNKLSIEHIVQKD
jgi:hypothetical protein